MTTTACRQVGRLATSTAAAIAAPQLMPHSMPSSFARRRAISKASSSLTWITSSMIVKVQHAGNEAGAEALDLVPARLQLVEPAYDLSG